MPVYAIEEEEISNLHIEIERTISIVSIENHPDASEFSTEYTLRGWDAIAGVYKIWTTNTPDKIPDYISVGGTHPITLVVSISHYP